MPTVSEKPEDYAAPTHTEVLSWFEKALNVNEPKPSVEMCIDLAEKFKLLRNRARNEQIQESARKENRALSLFEPGLRDTVFADWERAKLQPVIDAAGLFLDAADRLLVEVKKLGSHIPGGPDFRGYRFPSKRGDGEAISLEQIMEMLLMIGAVSPPPGAMGRPKKRWHRAGRKIGELIKETLKQLGYKRKLSIDHPESITAEIGAAVVNWAFGLKVGPSGFAAGMKRRDRRKKEPAKSFQEMHPGVEKIELADLSKQEQQEHLQKIQEKAPASNRNRRKKSTPESIRNTPMRD